MVNKRIILLGIFSAWLKDYKWYRRKKGGKWYKVMVSESLGGFDEPAAIWTNEEPAPVHRVIKTEDYTTHWPPSGPKN